MITNFKADNISQHNCTSPRKWKIPASLSIYFFVVRKFYIMNFHFIHERCFVHILGKLHLLKILMVCMWWCVCDVVTLTYARITHFFVKW